MADVLNGVVRTDIIMNTSRTIFSVFVSLLCDLEKFIGLLFYFFYIVEIHRS